MFSQALKTVSQFTLPVIISKRTATGQVSCACGAFIVLNRDGWVATAAHIADDFAKYQQHRQEQQQYETEKHRIESDQNIPPNRKRKFIARLPKNDEWITHISYYWGMPNCTINELRVNPVADLAVGRLEPFDNTRIREYPVLKNPNGDFAPGTSLCRLGFPFHKISATYDENANRFDLANGVLPVPFFPNDGIHTRVVVVSDQQDNEAEFIEASSPGLRGQSGGPIFDSRGHIWAVQSRTQSLLLGFSPVVRVAGREITEHQFMHVGWGSHVKELIRMLSAHNIQFQLSQ